jgi:hypothetical protein
VIKGREAIAGSLLFTENKKPPIIKITAIEMLTIVDLIPAILL